MIDFLLGVPGKLATIYTHLTTYVSQTRMTKIDSIDTTISSRAAASTALTNATWTDTKAGYLNASITSRAASSSALLPPIATNFGTTTTATTSSTTEVLLINISGSGVLKALIARATTGNTTGASSIYIRCLIDGIQVTTGAANWNGTSFTTKSKVIIGVPDVIDSFTDKLLGYDFIPFASSVQIYATWSGTVGFGSGDVQLILHRTA